jgi:hypothetical protein
MSKPKETSGHPRGMIRGVVECCDRITVLLPPHIQRKMLTSAKHEPYHTQCKLVCNPNLQCFGMIYDDNDESNELPRGLPLVTRMLKRTCVGSNGILECKSLSNTRTAPQIATQKPRQPHQPPRHHQYIVEQAGAQLVSAFSIV